MLTGLFKTAVLVVVLAMVAPTLAGKKQVNPGTVPPDATFRGKTYGEWHVAWWQWADKMTNAESPVLQRDGQVDTSNQSGNVWFLAGYFGNWFNPQDPVKFTRTITVPAGTALFFPILDGELTPAEYEEYLATAGADPLTQWELLESWLADPSLVEAMEAKIDGKLVRNLGAYGAPSAEPYSVTLPSDNHLKDYYPDGGEAWPVVCDGWCLLVEPLSVGQHEISFKANFGENLGMDITYKITVVPGRNGR
ncbi:MAG TPA: hypothetical protein VHP11_14875 [Tepidisphaeraceae bacterium]|nr:hypothetical protein [Tepidisphaeraceae bacterium]